MPHMLQKKYSVSKDVSDFLKLTHNPEFNLEIINLRKKHHIDLKKPNLKNPLRSKTKYSHNEIVRRLSMILELQKDIFKILRKFTLSDNWFHAVFDYILFENRLVIDNFKYRGFSIDSTKTDSKHTVSLELNKNATLDEIILKWPEIQRELEMIPGFKKGVRNKPSKNFVRDYKIYLSSCAGLNSKKIAHNIKDEYGDLLVEAEINSIISRINKEFEYTK